MTPQIAIITPNTLAGMGLAEMIHRMMPGAEARLFARFALLRDSDAPDAFFHYFVSASELMAGAAFFLRRQAKTIVLVHGGESGQLPQGFHTLDVYADEKQLARDMLALAGQAHRAHGAEPPAVAAAMRAAEGDPRLTPREREVLREVVLGRTNKEAAARLGVSTATVITHRKNLSAKLGTRSVAALTVYAVTHGIVRGEEI